MNSGWRSPARSGGGNRLPPMASAFVLILLLWAPGALAQDGYKIRSVSFEANTAISTSDLMGQMSQKGRSWFSEKVRRRQVSFYSSDLLEKDMEAIRRLYQKEGFLDVRVAPPRFEQDDAGQTVKIRIAIQEGKAVHIRSIKQVASGDSVVAGLVAAFQMEQATDARIRAGARFRDEDLLLERRRILDHLLESGYAYAAVDHELSVAASRDSVDVTWTIAGGPRCTFGAPRISGNQRVPTRLIAERIQFGAGDRFKGSKLPDSQRKVYSLGQFSVVSLKPALSEERSGIVPVDVMVREAPRTKTEVGAAYGKEEDFQGFLEIERLGFIGGARSLVFYAKHSTLEPINIALTFTQPVAPLGDLELLLHPYYIRQDEPGYTLDRLGMGSTVGWGLSADLYGEMTYTFEQVDLQSSADAEAAGDGGEEPDSLYDKSGVSFALTRSTGKPTFDPRRGSFNAIRLTYSGFPPSTYEFVKVIWDARRYDELIGGLVMASRIKAGYLQSFDADEFVPVEERFYSGGSNSVRGWERSTLGPLDETGDPLGGKSLLEGSIEFRRRGEGKLTPVVMFDFGNVWERTGRYPLNELQYSAGVGLRYSTPIGPVRVDVAKPVFGDPLPTQWIFSIGQAF